jgi:protein farnesyltransferase subunit beta
MEKEILILDKEMKEILKNILPDKRDVTEIIEPDVHLTFLFSFLKNHGIYHYFDIQKPWLIYWSINSISVFRKLDYIKNLDRKFLSNYLIKFQNKEGGFGGGIGYQSNILTTYAVILSLAILDDRETWEKIDRKKLKEFFLSMKLEDGSFIMHDKGEKDLRCVYAVLVVCDLLNILDAEIEKNVLEFIMSTESFEGGFGPIPFVEAHGGYTFCGIASLAILKKLDQTNYKKTLYWLGNKQKEYYGGFCGRTNKLVDSCYAFWQASIFNIFKEYHPKFSVNDHLLYDQAKLQKYLLYCCQNSTEGGFKDKPGKKNDIYHTNYALMGLALSTNNQNLVITNSGGDLFDWDYLELEDIHPVYAISRTVAFEIKDFFLKK